MGEKAMNTCKKGEAPIDMMANTPRKGKGKGKGKGGNKPGKCPTAEELMEKMEGGLCILKEVGWMTMIEDINTFPPNVSAALLGEEYDQCLDKIGLKESRKMKKCSYTEEEMALMEPYIAAVTKMMCFHYVMEYSCRDYVTQLMKKLMKMPVS